MTLTPAEPYPTLDPNRKEAHLRWGDSYPVIPLGKGAAPARLSSQRIFIGDRQVLEPPHTLLLSEKSGGARDLLRWWRERLDHHGQRWVYAQGELLLAGECELSGGWPAENGDGEAKRGGPAAILRAFGNGENHIAQAQVLIEWARGLGQPAYLMVRNLEALGEDGSLQVAQALRVASETKVCQEKLRIVVASTSESRFVDRADASGYWSIAHRYRLAPFTEAEVRTLASWKGPERELPGLDLDSETAQVILGKTGGQPLLVQRILQELRELLTGRPAVQPASRILRAYSNVRDSPPSAVRSWQQDLRSLLLQKPELVGVLKEYVLGHTLGPDRLPPHNRERSLLIAGWVRLNGLGRWGISSEFHAHIARETLDGLGTQEN